MMHPRQVHIAVFDCDVPVPNVRAKFGLYSDIFETLLRDAAKLLPSTEDLTLKFSKYDCVVGELPSFEELGKIDAILLTGAAAGAYDPEPWIYTLREYISSIYQTHPHIRLFGSCFGHQLICHALFSTPEDPVVSKHPNGYELGVQTIDLTPAFISHFGPVTSNPAWPAQLRQQMVHADHVTLHPMPDGFHSIGRTRHCDLQGVWKRDRVLTFQGHAEFDRFMNAETVKVFGTPIWDQKYMEAALEAVDGDDDSAWAAGVMLRFFIESAACSEEEIESEMKQRVAQGRMMAML